jgi:hypothetical protein
VHLEVDEEDDIIWKLMSNGQYSAASAHKMLFFSLIESSLYMIIWNSWAPPNVKNHAWLVLQNRLWTADYLRRRAWENCGFWPLYKQTKENNSHLFIYYRFTIRIWELLIEWLGIYGIQPRQ